MSATNGDPGFADGESLIQASTVSLPQCDL